MPLTIPVHCCIKKKKHIKEKKSGRNSSSMEQQHVRPDTECVIHSFRLISCNHEVLLRRVSYSWIRLSYLFSEMCLFILRHVSITPTAIDADYAPVIYLGKSEVEI